MNFPVPWLKKTVSGLGLLAWLPSRFGQSPEVQGRSAYLRFPAALLVEVLGRCVLQIDDKLMTECDDPR